MRWRETKKKVLNDLLKTVSSPYTIAPISSRLKAFIIDSFMLLMPLLYIVFYLVYGSREAFAEHMGQGWIFILVPYCVITSLFFHIKGQTPGYKAYDIALINTKTKQNPSLIMLVLRFITWLVVCASIVLLFVPFLRQDRLGLYDIISATAPIRK